MSQVSRSLLGRIIRISIHHRSRPRAFLRHCRLRNFRLLRLLGEIGWPSLLGAVFVAFGDRRVYKTAKKITKTAQTTGATRRWSFFQSKNQVRQKDVQGASRDFQKAAGFFFLIKLSKILLLFTLVLGFLGLSAPLSFRFALHFDLLHLLLRGLRLALLGRCSQGSFETLPLQLFLLGRLAEEQKN